MDPYQELTLYQRSAALMAAAQLGVFGALAKGPASATEIAQSINVPADSVARLMQALRALDYVGGGGDQFEINGFSEAFLREGAGGMVRLAWKEHLFYTAWSRLGDALTQGRALFPSYHERIEGDLPSVEKFLLALNDLAQVGAPGVIATGAFSGAASILDLGGGGGGYSAALAKALPEARITLADLPQILSISRGYLGRLGLGDRIEVTAADFKQERCGLGERTFECVLLSHILHDFDGAAAAEIVRRAADLLVPGGKLVIVDVLVPPGGQGNPVEALFDLMMLVEVPSGRSHPDAEVCAWIRTAGLLDPRIHKLYFGTLIEARAE